LHKWNIGLPANKAFTGLASVEDLPADPTDVSEEKEEQNQEEPAYS